MHEGIYAQLTRPWRKNGLYRLSVFSDGCGDGRCEQVRLYLEQMRTEDIGIVAAEAYKEAYKVVEDCSITLPEACTHIGTRRVRGNARPH